MRMVTSVKIWHSINNEQFYSSQILEYEGDFKLNFLITSTNFWSVIGYRQVSFYTRVMFLKNIVQIENKIPI